MSKMDKCSKLEQFCYVCGKFVTTFPGAVKLVDPQCH